MILVNGQWHWNCKPEAIVDATFGQSWHLCQQPLPPCVRCNKRSIVLFIDSAACASGRWSLDVAIHWNTFVVQHVETLRETQQIRQSWCLMILFCEMAMFMGSTGCRGKNRGQLFGHRMGDVLRIWIWAPGALWPYPGLWHGWWRWVGALRRWKILVGWYQRHITCL